MKNFSYAKKKLDLNNAAYEIVRQTKIQDAFGKGEALDHDDDSLGMDPGSSEHCHILRLYRLPDGIISWVDLEVNNNSAKLRTGTMYIGECYLSRG